MLKKTLFGIGLFLVTAVSLSGQTTQMEKEHPLEAQTPENPQYRERHTPIDHTGISKDPKFPSHRSTRKHDAPPVADSTAMPPVDDKQKPKN